MVIPPSNLNMPTHCSDRAFCQEPGLILGLVALGIMLAPLVYVAGAVCLGAQDYMLKTLRTLDPQDRHIRLWVMFGYRPGVLDPMPNPPMPKDRSSEGWIKRGWNTLLGVHRREREARFWAEINLMNQEDPPMVVPEPPKFDRYQWESEVQPTLASFTKPVPQSA